MADTCSICIDPFTKQPQRKKASCPYCDIQACVKCTQTYLLNSQDDPHCMGCRKGWSREVMDSILLTSWLNGEQKKHRENILIDREKSRLPAAQIIVERRIAAKALEPECAELRREINDMEVKLLNLRIKHNLKHQHMMALWRGEDPSVSRDKVEEERRAFIMPCPATGCRGYLSQAQKCGVCSQQTCPECRELKGEKDAAHTCDPNNVETVRALKKECRPCPTCGTNIFKIVGCFKKDTPILLWDGSLKMSQDIQVGDVLVGDDGNKRIVENLMNGTDMMQEVKQANGDSYIVNSKHKLVLKYTLDKSIVWSESLQMQKVNWFDRTNQCRKSKNFNIRDYLTKDNAQNKAVEFVNSFDFSDEIDMTIEDYLKLDDNLKKILYGQKSSCGINQEPQEVELDPQMLGLWLGDGTHSHPVIASNDYDVQKWILNWCVNNNCELVHDEAQKFRIRQNGSSTNTRPAIGNGSSCESCIGCSYVPQKICDMKKPYETNKNVQKGNYFISLLNKQNLVKNKHIPKEYLNNSRNVRLALLAGIIDTDGHVPKDQAGKRVVIVQTEGVLCNDIILLCRSLGFLVNVTKTERKNISVFGMPAKDQKTIYKINISGETLSEIPTIIQQKKTANSSPNKDQFRSSITVKEVGIDSQYGWSVSGNSSRFLYHDFTVVHNCDQMYCTSCNTPFSWKTGHKITSGVIHNPHYYDFLRASNGGVMPRTPGDIPCGDNLPSAQQQDRDVLRKQNFRVEDTSPTFIFNLIRILGHIRHDEIPRMTNHQEDNDNTDANCRYLMNEITEARWKQLLQQKEKRRMRRHEIRLCQEAFVGAGVDILGRLLAGIREVPPLNTHTSKSQVKLTVDGLRKQVLELCEESSKQILTLIEIFHQSLLQISQRQKCQVLKLDINKHEVKITKQKSERSARKRKGQEDDDDETTSDVDDDTSEDVKPKNKLVRT